MSRSSPFILIHTKYHTLKKHTHKTMISNTEEPPKLPLHTIPYHHDEQPSGMLTPPLQTTTATVPFRWEEQPGKPRPCTDMIIAPQQQKCLELPPRLTKIESKTLSPTTVLDGPSDLKGKTLLSSSFRFYKERRRLEGRHNKSFDSSDGWSTPVEDNSGQHVMLLGGGGSTAKGIFGSFRFKGSTDNKHNKVKGSSVISPLSTMDNSFFEEKKGKRLRRNSSLSNVTRSHFWATLYEGIKQVVPWRKRSKNERYSF